MLYSSSSCAWSPWSPLLRCQGWRASEKFSHPRFIPTFIVALSVTFMLRQTYHWNCCVLFTQQWSPSKPFGNFFTLLHKVTIHWKTSGKDALPMQPFFVKYFSPLILQASHSPPECWFECTIHTGVEWMQIRCCFLRNQSWIRVCPLDGWFHRSCFNGPSCCPKQAMLFFCCCCCEMNNPLVCFP